MLNVNTTKITMVDETREFYNYFNHCSIQQD